MRIAEVIGGVTLCRCHPSFQGARLRLAQPLSLADLEDPKTPTPKGRPKSRQRQTPADSIVVWDSLGAGIGSRIAVSEGAEAAQPFRPELKPVDAYDAAILDRVDIQIPLDAKLI